MAATGSTPMAGVAAARHKSRSTPPAGSGEWREAQHTQTHRPSHMQVLPTLDCCGCNSAKSAAIGFWHRNFLRQGRSDQRATQIKLCCCGPAAGWPGTGRPDRRSALTGSEQEGKPERDTRMEARRVDLGAWLPSAGDLLRGLERNWTPKPVSLCLPAIIMLRCLLAFIPRCFFSSSMHAISTI
jgi:hypothetical protein